MPAALTSYMEQSGTGRNGHCEQCGCTPSEATAEARALGLEQEFQAGIYTCCELDRLGEEQWRACLEAAVAEEAASELKLQANIATARHSDCRTGKQAGKINHVQLVRHVLYLTL